MSGSGAPHSHQRTPLAQRVERPSHAGQINAAIKTHLKPDELVLVKAGSVPAAPAQ